MAEDNEGFISVPEVVARRFEIAMPMTATEIFVVEVRKTALTAAARSTTDMDGETTLKLAEQFEEWLLRGIRR